MVDFVPPLPVRQSLAWLQQQLQWTSEAFPTAADLRTHCKSERHVYNTKRRLAGLKPISLEAWERKLRESRGAGAAAQNKGTSHLKAKKSRGGDGDGVESQSFQRSSQLTGVVKDEEVEWTPEHSLFDRKHFSSMEESLSYMWKTFGFSVPDREYCTDLPGLLTFLWQKISEQPHSCLFCNRRFPDVASVRRHMIDKNHTRIGTEARSRRGNVDQAGTEELQEELRDFYDYHGSTREITERISDPQQKVGALLRFFDADRDGLLKQKELAQLWVATTGLELSEAQYLGACSKAGADPEEGLDMEALGSLYQEGLADLETHWAVLQDLLAQKLQPPHQRNEGAEGKQAEDAESEEGEVDTMDEEAEEEEDGDERDGGSSSGTEIVECEDEDEFEEVMRVLGLQHVTLDAHGDLRLPSGAVAAHRDVAHIWRQRGQRLGQLAVAAAASKRPATRAPLMLSSTAAGSGGAVLTRKQQAREGKRIIAVLRRKQKDDLRLGMQHNILHSSKGLKVRTVFGDALEDDEVTVGMKATCAAVQSGAHGMEYAEQGAAAHTPAEHADSRWP
eukprot:CAMPEP_0179105788 /NCGR_PEP_ID=MMETSP0796-20121207/49147_1 /TAXON_ID=73915 /ORGANISM="Pyrodinium bahamense, Strain pbaha01" /LENGTH=561 /DNA_ID=CAMNT_0020803783 /DNA_START=31 /DNA_END=1715 /DNA_ORIENTATION=+